MKTITLNLYSFHELDKRAREFALTDHRDINVWFQWWEHCYDDFAEICSCLGIFVSTGSIKFIGFNGQGDGSTFAAQVDLLQLAEGIRTQAWRVHAPLQEFLFHLPDIDRRVFALIANDKIANNVRVISCKSGYDTIADLGFYGNEENDERHHNVFEELDKLEDWLRDIAKIMNRFLFKSLEQEYEYLLGDKAVEEGIISYDYLFTADGRAANYLNELSLNNQ